MNYKYSPELETSFKEMLESVEAGDTVTITTFSDVAANSRAMLELIVDLDDRGIRLKSLTESLDTGTEMGRYLAQAAKSLVQLDRSERAARQRDGIEAAKADGRYKGRKPIEVDAEAFDETVARWKAGEITAREAMKELNLKANTFYRRVKERTLEMNNTEEIKEAAKKLGEEIKTGVLADKDEVKAAVEKVVADCKDGSLKDKIKSEIESGELAQKLKADIESGDLAEKVKTDISNSAAVVGAELDIQKENLTATIKEAKERIELEKQVKKEAEELKK